MKQTREPLSTAAREPRPAPTGPGEPQPEPQHDSQRERLRLLFDALRDGEDQTVSVTALHGALESVGLGKDDQRLAAVHSRLDGARRPADRRAERLDLAAFEQMTRGSISLIERAIRKDLVVPEFHGFCGEIDDVFDSAAVERGGHVAAYIPQLARVDAEKFALGICTIDGQRHARGDHHDRFCLQSTCKPINYCLALEDEGATTVHAHIGREPSGRTFNELSLNHRGLPHNPMINAGAIMACSLIGRKLESADRFDHVLNAWQRLTGGVRPGFDNAVYLSERKTADRNFALGYFMREHKAFPPDTDLTETLEFYFQCCSLEIDVDRFAVVAATLANGGICPLTEERVLSPQAVQNCLSLMYSCGMYDFSGEWAFTVGLPAKSGVSGVILVVVPNTLGLAVWSPRLDHHGNSVRGIAFCQELVRRFNFHHYDNLVGGQHGKQDPRKDPSIDQGVLLGELLWAASKGDVHGMRRIAVRGFDLGAADYDGRTALHLAASEGRTDAVRYLLEHGVPQAPVDRWKNTPLDDAKREGHAAVVGLLG